jgi:hypothetical protein
MALKSSLMLSKLNLLIKIKATMKKKIDWFAAIYKAIALGFLVLLMLSCSTTKQGGCKYGEPKKSHNGIPKGFLSMTQNRTPVNIQVEVVQIVERTTRMVHCRTVSSKGQTIDVKYYSGGLFASTKRIQVGTKLTLHGWEEMECGKWNVGRIQINN